MAAEVSSILCRGIVKSSGRVILRVMRDPVALLRDLIIDLRDLIIELKIAQSVDFS